jgi:PIN like domain
MADKRYSDPLVRQRIFPEAAQIFAFGPIGLLEAINDALVVVDTNVLLVPYGTGRASLDQIRRTLERLVNEKRLRVPGQVAREFADNRAEKLKTLFQQLSRKRDTHLARSEYPLLEGIPAYLDVTDKETQVIAALEEYRKAVGTLLDTVAAWCWDDPISKVYRDLFAPSLVVDPTFDRDGLLQELAYRQEHRLPPGYKDANNEYSGVGDLVIWKTILKIGGDESRHLIFVSGDEKTDWRYQSENRALYPRFELMQEYRAASKGKSFLIITLAELLEQLGASTTVVEEVRKEEVAASAPIFDDTVSGSRMQNAPTDLTIESLEKYLRRKYPDRTHRMLGEYTKLVRQLKAVGVRSLADLDLELAKSEPLFEKEEERRIASGEGKHFADVGVVRVSLRLAGILI